MWTELDILHSTQERVQYSRWLIERGNEGSSFCTLSNDCHNTVPCFHLFEGLNWTARQNSLCLWLMGYTYRRRWRKGSCFCLCSFCVWGEVSNSWILMISTENSLLGNRKKIAKFFYWGLAAYPSSLVDSLATYKASADAEAAIGRRTATGRSRSYCSAGHHWLAAQQEKNGGRSHRHLAARPEVATGKATSRVQSTGNVTCRQRSKVRRVK